MTYSFGISPLGGSDGNGKGLLVGPLAGGEIAACLSGRCPGGPDPAARPGHRNWSRCPTRGSGSTPLWASWTTTSCRLRVSSGAASEGTQASLRAVAGERGIAAIIRSISVESTSHLTFEVDATHFPCLGQTRFILVSRHSASPIWGGEAPSRKTDQGDCRRTCDVHSGGMGSREAACIVWPRLPSAALNRFTISRRSRRVA